MNVTDYFKIFFIEIKKISWISFAKATSIAGVVLLAVSMVMVFFVLIDYVIIGFLSFLFRYANV